MRSQPAKGSISWKRIVDCRVRIIIFVNPRMKKVLPALLILFCIQPACKKAKDPGPNEVYMENKMFVPNQLNVTVGTTVTWTNQEAVIHTVTSDNGLFDSGKMD